MANDVVERSKISAEQLYHVHKYNICRSLLCTMDVELITLRASQLTKRIGDAVICVVQSSFNDMAHILDG